MGKLSKNVGLQIKKIREAKGIKQFALAEMLDMEPSNLTRIESGYQFPKEENLQKIADCLDVQVKELFNFNQKLSKEEMMNEINSSIDKLNINEIEFLHKLIKLYAISK